MIRKIGFHTQKYLSAQVKRILERVALFDKLYLEFGGKLRYDNHASRVLPGYALDTKMRMLQRLGGKIEFVHCISAKDIEWRKIRRDFGLTYEDQIIKDIADLRDFGLDVSAVVINRFSEEKAALKFRQRLENRGIRVYIHYEIPNYLTDPDRVVGEEGYGKPEYVETETPMVVVTAPGPGSGKMSFCMAQVYQDRKRGLRSGFAKFETFPIWNLELNHPVNVAYEAATADIGDYALVDPFHLEAYGVEAINYNRDVENFAIMKKIIEKMVPADDPMASIRSPTDMGVNMAKEGIIDDDVCREAARQEIVRRHFRYNREFVEGDTTHTTLERMERIMQKVGVEPQDRAVVLPAREAAEDARRRMDEGKGYRGVFVGAAIELYDESGVYVIIQGKNSPLLHAESAAILNATKTLAGIPDDVEVISRTVIESMRELKRTMGLNSASLDVKEILDALAASAVSDENAWKCINSLEKLSGCEMHTTHLMDSGDEIPLKQLGLNITTDAKLPFPNNFGGNAGFS
ncbi:MAG: DUF1846 family protein [Candidatus Bathyarchaeota archaeon]|nr:MAG: DUF1846 family protein [Candidatus Bathyarchaeota archaeon]